MKKKRISPLFRLIKWLIWVFYPRIETVGLENLPDEPVMIVANHTQMNGPIACEIHFPGKRYTWCASEMMELKEVPAYAYRDFWSGKPRGVRWLYRILSYIVAPLSVVIFNNADTIPVYRDARILTTFLRSLDCLVEGANVVVFPECAQPHNHIVYEFQEGFVDIARLYLKKTGKKLKFVPMYIAPKLKKMYLGAPVEFKPENPVAAERRRICDEMMNAITDIAVGLPRHIVIPYLNIAKKDYPYNKPQR